MLIAEEFQGQDIYDFAAHKGSLDAARGNPKEVEEGPDSVSEVAWRYSLIYALAYDLEQLTRVLAETSSYKAIAFVRTWDDCYGQGEVEFVVSGTLKRIFFSYTELQGQETVEQGDNVEIIYTYSPKGDAIVTSVRLTNIKTSEPVE